MLNKCILECNVKGWKEMDVRGGKEETAPSEPAALDANGDDKGIGRYMERFIGVR